jgi:tubulin-specific chaperone D
MDHETEVWVDKNAVLATSRPKTTTVSESILFVEYREASECIHSLINTSSSDVQSRNASLSRIRDIFDKYLDCPSLLDHHIQPMVQQLTDSALDHLRSLHTMEEFASSPLPHLLSTIYSLSKVRGRKRIQKFLPHEVDVVEIVLKGLQVLETADEVSSSTMGSTEESIHGPQRWESVYALWNWMAILSLVPFDCSVVADATLVSSLIELATSHLSHPGPTREMAAASLASWLARPDLEKTHLNEFIHWSKNVLSEFSAGRRRDVFLPMGAIHTIVTILKVSTGDRRTLVDLMMPVLWESTLRISERNASDLLFRKLLIKWWTRLGCACLPPRVAPWRYQRGSRSLTENVRNGMGETKNGNNWTKDSSNKPDTTGDGEEDIFYVPEQVEDAMGQIISGLTDSSTNVRWSSAKGIGRITDRLPSICADDILDAVLQLFDNLEKDHAWHGACLALAELARRGLLLPHRLREVVPRIAEAVHVSEPTLQRSLSTFL